jgi:tetratricopeptide (TPR) repeat protein
MDGFVGRHGIRRLFCLVTYPLVLVAVSLAQSSPDYGEAFQEAMSKGRFALAQRNFPDAIKQFKKAVKASNEADWNAYLGLTTAYFRMGDLKEVKSVAHKLVELASDDQHRAEAHAVLGLAFYADRKKKENLTLAEAEFRTAQQSDPSFPDPYFNIGKILLEQGKDEEGIEWLRKFLELAPKGSANEESRRLIAKPELARADRAPNFVGASQDGQPIELAAFRGRIVLLDFWATWCKPCEEAIPDIERLAHTFPEDQLVILSISVDDVESDWRKYVIRRKMNWPQCRDQQYRIYESMRLRPAGQYSVPAYVLLNPDGVVLGRFINDISIADIKKKIEAELQKALEVPAK